LKRSRSLCAAASPFGSVSLAKSMPCLVLSFSAADVDPKSAYVDLRSLISWPGWHQRIVAGPAKTFGDQSHGSGGCVPARPACEPADLASREPKSFSGSDGLEFTVDDGLNALQSIEIAPRICSLQSLEREVETTRGQRKSGHFYLAETGHFYLAVTSTALAKFRCPHSS
jgi:hypothetical protein